MSLTMANSMVTPDESYGFNLEWISEGTGMEEEICGVEKDCIIVPSSPVLPKIEPDDPLQTQIDEYVEIQVTEEEVVTEQQWQNQHNGLFDFSNDMDMGMRTGSEDDVPLPENQDEYSRLHPYPCDFCSRRFSKKAAMTVHMLSHQIERPHDCNLCSKSFKRKFDLVEHMKVHAYNPLKDDEDYENLSTVHEAKAKLKKKKKKVKNVVLQGLTEKKQKKPTYTHFTSALEEEMRLMVESEESDSKFPVIDPARPYVCQHCGVGFAREKALLSHNMIHAGDSAFECDKCHEMFQTERLLIQHKTKKHGRMSPLTKKKSASIPDTERLNVKEEVIDLNEEHMCQLCLIIFNTAEELVAHRADHDQDIGIHACYLCNEVIDTLEELRDHIRLRHNSTHCCVRCNKVFKDQPTLTYHLTTHEPQMMTCPICSRKFTSKLSFRKHISTHEDKQTLLCSDCGNLFMDGKSLLYHKQSEHNLNMSRLFPCMECGKTFNSRSSQQIHIRIHTGEKPYGCRFCWKAFGDGGTLRKHERIHTGEKPYVCPVCSKAFNQRVVLREHVRAHHSGNEGKLSDNCYECIVCGQLFTNSSELCAHLVQHSDENTAKHRLPTSRKAAKKRKFPPNPATRSVAIMNEVLKEDPIYEKLTSTESLTSNSSFNPIFADDTILSDEHFFVAPSPPKKKHSSPIRQVREPMEVIKPSDTLDSMSSILKSSPKRARIVRSGKKGFHKGQNKRFQKGKSKTSKLLNNSSYASKYVVSQPNDFLNEDVNFNDDLDIANSLFNEVDDFPRNRPRTKNVSYHNLKPEKLEPATFPVQAETFPKKKKKKITKTKKVKSPQKKFDLNDIHPTIDAQYVNGIDPSLFEEHNSGEPIETCIVDDFDVEFKLEDRTSDVEIIEEIDIKPELVSCDMCSEVFTNRHDLFNHVQIHI